MTTHQANRPTLATAVALVAACTLVAGTSGCSLPHTYPVTTETSSGPSPYGIWYEQHWATNSVLLAAADQPGGEIEILDDSEFDVYDEDAAIEEALQDYANAEAAAADTAATAEQTAADTAEEAADRAEAAYEASAARAADFDNSTPYQFPASDYAPAATGAEGDPSDLGRGSIRY